MIRYCGSLGLLTALLLALPAVAADKKNTDPQAKTSTAQDYQALADAHTATGKLVSVGGSDKSLSLRIEYPVVQPNPNAIKNTARGAQHLIREQQEIMRTRNPLTRAIKLQQFEAQLLTQQVKSLNDVKITREHKDFDLDSTDKVVVRYQDPPVQYDDKGNLIKYTAAELKELRGKNPDLPGYEADFDKLTPGQTVKVTLAKPKADKEKDKDAAANNTKPQVSMIVITAEAPLSDSTPAKGKKNNK
jgi:hypothetical protein